MWAGALAGPTRAIQGPNRANSLPFWLTLAGTTPRYSAGRPLDRLLALDRKTDPHSARAALLAARGQRQIDLLQRSSRPLDRNPAKRRNHNKVSLLKRGNVWWAYFYVDGVRHQQSTGTSNRKRAQTIEAKLREEANNSRFQLVQADPNMTFGELAVRFVSSGSVRPHHLIT